MNFFVENSFLGKLIVDVMLRGLLESGVFTVYDVFNVVVVVMVAVACAE